MKKITLLLLFVSMSFALSAQMWIELGGKGMWGLRDFYNGNIINDREHTYQLSTGLSYGGNFSLNFADRHGINVEGLLSKYSQNFTHITPDPDIESNVSWETFDAYLLYRAYSQGGFFEIGPKMTTVSAIEQTYAGAPIPTEGFYNDTYYSVAFGFGGFIVGSEFLTLKMGARFEYALTDLVSNAGQQANYPAFYNAFDEYKSTHPFSASLNVELNFAIGGVARAECGRRSFIFGSGYR